MDQERLLRELTDFLRIPSVSTLPVHNQDCRAAAEWVAAELRRLGGRDVDFLGSETHPVVWGKGPDVPGAPTLLIYGHYDVQPPDPLAEWTQPPFEPTISDGRIYARGAADDKGQVFCLLKAIAAAPRPAVNFRFLIEGEEEYGSKVFFDLFPQEPQGGRADSVLLAGLAVRAPRGKTRHPRRSDREGEHAARAQSKARDGRASARRRDKALCAQACDRQRAVSARRRSGADQDRPPRLHALAAGLQRGHRPGNRGGARRGIDPRRAGPRLSRCSGDPHRDRAAGRPAACPQRKAGIEAAVGWNRSVQQVLRTAGESGVWSQESGLIF